MVSIIPQQSIIASISVCCTKKFWLRLKSINVCAQVTCMSLDLLRILASKPDGHKNVTKQFHAVQSVCKGLQCHCPSKEHIHIHERQDGWVTPVMDEKNVSENFFSKKIVKISKNCEDYFLKKFVKSNKNHLVLGRENQNFRNVPELHGTFVIPFESDSMLYKT